MTPKPDAKMRRVGFKFAWYDLWIGAFYDRRERVLYVCPLPMFVVKVIL